MAGEAGTTPHTLALDKKLAERPFDFDFFQALRWVECRYADKPRLGESLRSVDDPIRLAQEPSLRFAPSTLASYESDDARPPRISVYFLGMFGPNGPLPQHMTEHAFNRLHHHDDPTLNRFLDVFHHRVLALFYRAWANAQPTVCLDRPQSDRFSVYVGSLLGLGMPSLRNRDPAPDLAKLYFAGHFANQTHHPEGLASILRGYFRMPVAIHEFIGDWITLPYDCRWRLGESRDNSTLGMTVILGAQTWECQHKFRIVVGPISLTDYERLLPGEDALARFVALVRQYVGDEIEWDLNLRLEKEEVPPLRLGEMGRLGWTTWLRSEPFEQDADDLKLDPFYWMGEITNRQGDAQKDVAANTPVTRFAKGHADQESIS